MHRSKGAAGGRLLLVPTLRLPSSRQPYGCSRRARPTQRQPYRSHQLVRHYEAPPFPLPRSRAHESTTTGPRSRRVASRRRCLALPVISSQVMIHRARAGVHTVAVGVRVRQVSSPAAHSASTPLAPGCAQHAEACRTRPGSRWRTCHVRMCDWWAVDQVERCKHRSLRFPESGKFQVKRQKKPPPGGLQTSALPVRPPWPQTTRRCGSSSAGCIITSPRPAGLTVETGMQRLRNSEQRRPEGWQTLPASLYQHPSLSSSSSLCRCSLAN